MSNQSSFPEKPATVLNRDELVNYLLQQHSRGYQVFQSAGLNGAFEIVLSDIYSIKFISNDDIVEVKGCTLSHAGWQFEASSLAELNQAVDYVAKQMIGAEWETPPTSARLSEGAFATNFATISSLIGTSAITAIFDPYLENRSLATLINILSFGAGNIANDVRVLSTDKTTSGKLPRFTKFGFDAWLNQLGITGEVRLMSSSEHRRFILLNSGQSLLLGPSLNSIHKNEAVRLEPDTHDKTFFNEVWSEAALLI